MKGKEYTLSSGGDTITLVFSDMARQATASVLVKQGGTAVHVAVTLGAIERLDLDFVPLTVEYEERFYARGVILGSQYIRREGKPSDEAVLTARMIDRALRPLFPSNFRRDIQVVALVLALDETHEPGALALIGAGAALSVSSVPWNGPLAAIRATRTHDTTTLDTPYTEALDVEISLVAAFTKNGLLMLETEAREASEAALEAVVTTAEKAAQVQLAELDKIIAAQGLQKQPTGNPSYPAALSNLFLQKYASEIDAALTKTQEPLAQKQSLVDIKSRFLAEASAGKAGDAGIFVRFWEESLERKMVSFMRSGKRLDGRKADELRLLSAECGGISALLHGSGTFYRGETRVISFLTKGNDLDALRVDGIEKREEKHFIHQYYHPPYASGETGRMTPNRRAIGHGALAEKALRPVLPVKSTFPHTLRLVSEVFSSNGSTSMASICAGSLALRDGGVPTSNHVAGVAIGLVSGENGEATLLTDIQGPEDHYGEMDCKVAGTRKGITAIQLDLKRSGISRGVFMQAVKQARTAHEQILSVMEEAEKKKK